MTVLQSLGLMAAVVSLGFLAGFGLMLGAWAGVHMGAKWFGPLNIQYTNNVTIGSPVSAHASSAAPTTKE